MILGVDQSQIILIKTFYLFYLHRILIWMDKETVFLQQ